MEALYAPTKIEELSFLIHKVSLAAHSPTNSHMGIPIPITPWPPALRLEPQPPGPAARPFWLIYQIRTARLGSAASQSRRRKSSASGMPL